ncbi:hypothetical protein ARMGADRAFT_126903 [Armillaria gallica]|uniref:Uncharacterized protein n=1 Tax=Armillaria gallica TaxID=47427 RepID=A0A2H3DPX5_ARMGA|nr:hypothetical protein ARMGADRAFT_126903 [Armillaria gallica]
MAIVYPEAATLSLLNRDDHGSISYSPRSTSTLLIFKGISCCHRDRCYSWESKALTMKLPISARCQLTACSFMTELSSPKPGIERTNRSFDIDQTLVEALSQYSLSTATLYVTVDPRIMCGSAL